MSGYQTQPAPRLRAVASIATPETERERQIQLGRRMSEAEQPRFAGNAGSRPKPATKPNAPKGHEALLKALETSGASIEVDLRDTDTPVVGVVKRSDAYTVSLEVETPSGAKRTRVIFKHAMIGFSPLTPRPAKETASQE